MSGQEMAEKLAEESLKRFGFVVVAYKNGTFERNQGKPTNTLWHEYKMPQPFVPVRKGTMEEWTAQCRLFENLFGFAPQYEDSVQVPVVLVTD